MEDFTKPTLSKSYGTVTYERLRLDNGKTAAHRVLHIFADKAAELKEDGPTVFGETYKYEIDSFEYVESIGDIDDMDEIISTSLTKKDIEEKAFSDGEKPLTYGKVGEKTVVVIGEYGSVTRSLFNERTDARTEVRSNIWLFHNGERVKIKLPKRSPRSYLCFVQGIEASPDGSAKVTVSIFKKETGAAHNDFDVLVTYWDKDNAEWSDKTAVVAAKDLTLEYASLWCAENPQYQPKELQITKKGFFGFLKKK